MTVQMYEVGEEPFSWRHLAKKRKTNVFRLFHIFKENASSSKWKKYGHAIFKCKFLQFSNHSKIKSENLLEKNRFYLDRYFFICFKFSKWVVPLWKCIEKSRRLHKSFLENKLLQGSTWVWRHFFFWIYRSVNFREQKFLNICNN